MQHDTTHVHEYFTKLGFDPVVADIYLALHTHGAQSLLQLSRSSGVERTRLYRLLDTLHTAQLIETEEQYKGKRYKAAPLTNLQILLARREEELRGLQSEMFRLNDQLQQTDTLDSGTHVQFYQGADGLKQMLWNQTRAQGDSCSILYENMQSRTNRTFFERWAERCNERGLHFRSLVGPHFVQSQTEWYASHANVRLDHWSGRLIADEVFPLRHSTVIYDNVVAFFDWKAGDLYGIEIYNEHIAQSQRQLFELLWQQATPLEVTS